MEQAWLDLEAGRVREDERARDLERERQEKGRTESRRQRQGHRRQGCGDRDAEERYLSIGVIWSDNEIIDNFAVVNQNTESYDNKYTA